jgi:hypothetical protein
MNYREGRAYMGLNDLRSSYAGNVGVICGIRS